MLHTNENQMYWKIIMDHENSPEKNSNRTKISTSNIYNDISQIITRNNAKMDLF